MSVCRIRYVSIHLSIFVQFPCIIARITMTAFATTLRQSRSGEPLFGVCSPIASIHEARDTDTVFNLHAATQLEPTRTNSNQLLLYILAHALRHVFFWNPQQYLNWLSAPIVESSRVSICVVSSRLHRLSVLGLSQNIQFPYVDVFAIP